MEQRFDAENTYFGTTQKVFGPSNVRVFRSSEHKWVYMTNMPLVIGYSFKGTVLHLTVNTLLWPQGFRDMTLDLLKAVNFTDQWFCIVVTSDRCITQQVRPTCFTIVQKSWKNARLWHHGVSVCTALCSCVWVTAGGRVSPQAQAVFRHFHDRIKGFSRTKKVHFSLIYGRSNLCGVKSDVNAIMVFFYFLPHNCPATQTC